MGMTNRELSLKRRRYEGSSLTIERAERRSISIRKNSSAAIGGYALNDEIKSNLKRNTNDLEPPHPGQ